MSTQDAKECIQTAINVPFMDLKNIAELITSYTYDSHVLSVILSIEGSRTHRFLFPKFMDILQTNCGLIEDMMSKGCLSITIQNTVNKMKYFSTSYGYSSFDEFVAFVHQFDKWNFVQNV